MTAILHHYVSKFYLKQFAKEKTKTPDIYRYDKRFKKGRMASTGKSAASDHFNSIPWLDEPDLVEKAYANFIESPATKPFKSVIENRTLDAKNLDYILLFLALTTARTPKIRSLNEKAMKQLDAITIASALGGEEAAPLIKNLHDNRYPEGRFVEIEVDTIVPIYQCFKTKHWSLHQTSEDAGDLITGDFPVVILHADSPRPWGFNSPNVAIYAPISPDLAMMGTSNPIASDLRISRADVATLNGKVFNDAERYIFSRSEDFYIDHLDGSGIQVGLKA